MSRPARGPTAKLTVIIPANLKTRLTRAIEAADLAAINLTSVVAQALEAYAPTLERLATAAIEQRQYVASGGMLRKLERHSKQSTINKSQETA